MKSRLFNQIDNAPLIIFRIFFGFLLACETFGAILTGWVKKNFIDVKFTFSHIGMEWLQPLPGNGMYYYFAAMGILGLLIMAGYRYRWTLGAFTILWAGVYFMQKTSYNNHYYLLLLVSIMMWFLPADKYASADVARQPSLKRLTMPAWCAWVMIAQVTIVYLFATVSKFYPGWLNGDFTRLILQDKIKGVIGNPDSQQLFYLFIAYAGIAFDMLVVPMLLFKKTRTIALVASLLFHIFNAVTLHIGIFPFFALSFVVFFYPPDKMRRLFLRKKTGPAIVSAHADKNKYVLFYFFIPYLVLQLALPLRHYFIEGDVLWTEEGHRLSWRMMLRERFGTSFFTVVDKATGHRESYEPSKVLTDKQKHAMATKPDMIWQMAQYIKSEYGEKGKDVEVYVKTFASINNGPARQLIDPDTDLAAARWDHLKHCDWILLYDHHGNIVD